MGDPGKASLDLLPGISWSSDANYLQLRGYSEAACSYIAVQENLMDDAHFNYLHCPEYIDWAAEQPKLWQPLPKDIQVTERSVTTIMEVLDVAPAPVEAAASPRENGSIDLENALGIPGTDASQWST